jgi:hypothetical protein
MAQFKISYQNMHNTESTNFNSDAATGSKQIPHPQQQYWKQKEVKNQEMAQNQQLSMQLQNSSVGSGGHIQMLDEANGRDIILKNAKSLGNSLGTANKKSLNISQHCDKMLNGIPNGIDQNGSTLNDGQFFTLAKTGILSNLNLS